MNITFASLFTGVGGFDLGMERAGMEMLWGCERDAACQKILARQFPNKKIYDDITTLDATGAAKPTVLVGSSPCQGFSLAGARGSLQDERSNLCFQFCRIADELNPDVVCWENVGGVLSTEDNAFGCFLAALVGLDTAIVPPRSIKRWGTNDKGIETFSWTSAGMVVGPKRVAAWRIIDSQYCGVAQRRERLYVVTSPIVRVRSMGEKEFCDARGVLALAPTILFEPESMRRNYPPSRQAREDIAGTLTSGSGGGRYDRQPCVEVSGMQQITGALTPGAHPCGYNGQDAYNGLLIPEKTPQTRAYGMRGFGDYEADSVSSALKQRDYKDATDLVEQSKPIAIRTANTNANGKGFQEDVAYTLDTAQGQAIAFESKGAGDSTEEMSPTLRAMNHRHSNANGGGQVAVYHRNASCKVTDQGDVAAALKAQGEHSYQFIKTGSIIRRLAPVECERLQGFPDDHTAGQPDSTRYRQLGNAVTENAAEWLGRRVVFAIRHLEDLRRRGLIEG